MSIADVAIRKRTITVFSTIVLLVAGLAAYTGLGQLEDPEFTVKTAVVVTMYPGATAEEVELEVTDRVEIALQEMPQLKELESFSRAGMSLVSVYIKPKYKSHMLPQIWDELRKKVRDIRSELPPGAGTPTVSDDFGDVYGFLMAVVGDGFSPAELERYVDMIKKELSLVPGVARVELWGDQSECVYIDISEARLAQLGVSNAALQRTLTLQNVVVPSGGLEIDTERLRLQTTGEFSSPEDIGNLVIRGDEFGDPESRAELIRIRDIADVRRGYLEPTNWAMRYNGVPCIGVSVSNMSGTNVVTLGEALEQRLEELKTVLPVGIEVQKISWQEDLVADAISSFMISLAQAVGIVLVVLWIFMGLRTAFIVGMTGLVFVIVGSFLFMNLFGIDLQRMSLGALIIAMGMMVDNAIVVADGIIVRMQQGLSRVKAAVEAATQPAWPLLGATFVAVMAFYPIAASDESAGEYCATLFSVVAIALMLSWVLSVTVSPVLCIALLPAPKALAEGADPFGSGMYRVFRRQLELAMRLRWIVVVLMLGMLVASFAAFRYVPQMFFPASARPQFMIDYWAPEGTRIQTVSAGVRPLEDRLVGDPRVAAVSTFIGQGPPRFYLPVDPESPYPSYGQLIVNVHDFRDVDALIADLGPWVREHVPQALVVPRKYGLGPSETWPVEVRISGPAIADPVLLRSLAAEAADIVRASPQALVVRTNWRQRVKKVELDYNEDNARWTGISRADIGGATQRAFDGLPVGQYREEDKLLPILLRHVEPERQGFASNIQVLQVRPPITSGSVPLAQVTSAIDVAWEDPLIWRWDRRRAITMEAVPRSLATVLRADIREAVEAMDLPPGYEMMWDGEFRSSQEAQASLIPGMIPAAIVIALIVVGLFNAYRPPLIILLVVPFAMIGVTAGLLLTGQPFGFVALLGAMSLGGMMIKNAIVLLDQVNIEKAAGKVEYEAVVYAALSRLRPVMLAAATTVLGVVPLLPDVFWVSMAVTIMFGLAFGAILTMVAVPVLYAILFRLEAPGA